MTIAELSPPVGKPLTLAEVKAHLRLDHDADDALLSHLIRTVREHLERETGLALLTRTFRLYLDAWPKGRVLTIAMSPVRSVEGITCYNENGAPGEADMTGFTLDSGAHPARLFLPVPPASRRAINGIEIDFTAGFGQTGADVPDTLKRAMLLHLALLYEFRGAVAAADQPAAVPAGYDRLLAPYRMKRL